MKRTLTIAALALGTAALGAWLWRDLAWAQDRADMRAPARVSHLQRVDADALRERAGVEAVLVRRPGQHAYNSRIAAAT